MRLQLLLESPERGVPARMNVRNETENAPRLQGGTHGLQYANLRCSPHVPPGESADDAVSHLATMAIQVMADPLCGIVMDFQLRKSMPKPADVPLV
jgi:hypothetical protein